MRTRTGNKKTAILDAAVREFAREGYHQARITRIAEEAGVAAGSLYLYFKNKDAILHELFASLWQGLARDLQAIETRTGKSASERIDGMVDLLFDTFASNPSLAIVFVNEQQEVQRAGTGDYSTYYTDFLDRAQQVIVDGMRNGEFHNGFDVSLLRIFVLGGLRRLLHEWAQHPELVSLDKIRADVKTFLRHGLSPHRVIEEVQVLN